MNILLKRRFGISYSLVVRCVRRESAAGQLWYLRSGIVGRKGSTRRLFARDGEHPGERLCPPEIFRGPFGVVWVSCDAGRNARFLSLRWHAQLALAFAHRVSFGPTCRAQADHRNRIATERGRSRITASGATARPMLQFGLRRAASEQPFFTPPAFSLGILRISSASARSSRQGS